MRDRGRPREDDVIEGQLRKRGANIWAASHHGDFFFRVIFADQLSHEVAGLLSKLRRLNHRPIARSKNICHGRKGQVDREVPRTDDADHAFGLVLDLGLGPEQAEREFHFAFFGPHPFTQMFAGEF